MLCQGGRELVLLRHLTLELFDRCRGVFDFRTQHLTHGRRDFGVIHLDRAVKAVNFTLVPHRVGQDVGDYASLVVGSNGSVTTIRKGELDFFLGPDLLGEVRVREPIGEERGA
ncbi:hypothetical protein D3C76_1202020 [compost metagenome]